MVQWCTLPVSISLRILSVEDASSTLAQCFPKRLLFVFSVYFTRSARRAHAFIHRHSSKVSMYESGRKVARSQTKIEIKYFNEPWVFSDYEKLLDFGVSEVRET